MIHADHAYVGRLYAVPHALTARIECSHPTHGQIAGWAGVQGVTWKQGGVYATADHAPSAYAETGSPYKLDTGAETTATVTIKRLPFGYYRITMNGRDYGKAWGTVWAGVERIDGADGDCSVKVTIK